MLLLMVTMVVAYCGGTTAHRAAVTRNHRVTVVTGNTAANGGTAGQIYCVGMIVTVSAAADATTANYDIVAVVVLKASVVVDYYAMITAYAAIAGTVDCTTVAVTVLIGVARCGNYVMLLLLLLLGQVLLQNELMVSFQGNRREHHAGAVGRRK